MGEDHPTPGIAVFQAMFSVCDHLSGKAGSSATPVDPGPRNCGHCRASGKSAAASESVNNVVNNLSMAPFYTDARDNI
jgi:hypothetical protein